MAQTPQAPSPATPPAAPAAPEPKGDGKKKGNVTGQEMTQNFLRKMEASRAALAAVKLPGDVPTPAPAVVPTPGAEAAPTAPPAEGTPAAPVPAPAPTPAPEQTPELPDADAPFDLSQLSQFDAKTQELVKGILSENKKRMQEALEKRIGKEVKERKQLEGQLAQLGKQLPASGLAAPAMPAITPPPAAALPDITDGNQLALKQQEARLYRQKADDALALGPADDGRYTIDGTALTKTEVIEVRRNATDMLEVKIPQHYQFMVQRQQALGAALQEFPWLKDTASPEYQQAMGLIQQAPYLRNLPNAELVVGTLVEGLKAREARKAPPVAVTPPAPTPAPAKPKPPSDQSATGGSPASPGRASADSHAERALAGELEKLKAQRGVRGKDLAAYLARRDQLSQLRQ